MRLLTDHLLFLASAGFALVVASFVRLRFVWPQWRVVAVGAVLLVLAAVGVVKVFLSPPGQVETEVERIRRQLPSVPVTTALARLKLVWDSEANANWPAAETLAQIGEIAYEPPHSAEKSFRALGFDKFMPVVQGSMIGYVISGDDVTVIAFRGTDFPEISDWLANLGRSAIDTEHGPVHKGFYNAYQSMKWQVNAILQERNTKHLWVTGHSLGGALALLCAYDLEVEGRQLHGIMTFGQPMVARQQFADYIDQILVGRYVRFVNEADIVPKVPPSHVSCGSLVWFTNGELRRSFVRPPVFVAPAADDPISQRAPNPEPVKQAEIEPLTEAEFDALQARLRAENAAKERLPEGTPMAAAPNFVDDHSMSLYREKIQTLFAPINPNE